MKFMDAQRHSALIFVTQGVGFNVCIAYKDCIITLQSIRLEKNCLSMYTENIAAKDD